jgi:hypothetical protein
VTGAFAEPTGSTIRRSGSDPKTAQRPQVYPHGCGRVDGGHLGFLSITIQLQKFGAYRAAEITAGTGVGHPSDLWL